MGIPIEKSFTVKAARAAVWEFLTDPQRVARCLPGAAITGKVDDRSWGGTITVKVGPVTANYRGTMRFERLDAAAGEAEIAASGQETRGKGGADMRMKSRVVERAPGETEVTVTSDVNVVGVLAQFGRGMIQDVSDQLFQKFSAAMRRELEEAAGPGGGSAETSGATAGGVATPAPAADSSAGPVGGITGGGPGGAQAGAATGSGQPGIGGSPSTPAVPVSTEGLSGAPGAPAAGGAEAAAAAVLPGAPARRGAAARHAQPAPPPAAAEPALDLGALGAAAAARAAGRTLRRPGFWIAVVVVAAIVYLLVR